MTQRSDISALFTEIRTIVNQLAGAELSPPERAVVSRLCDYSLRLVESIVVDINRIADALEKNSG